MSDDTEKRLAGFVRVAEEAYQKGTAQGWRITRDSDGWVVEVLDPVAALVAGRGETLGQAITALVEGLDWIAEGAT